MKLLLPLLLLLAACGKAATDLTISVSGVTMSDVESIKADLARVADIDVSEVKAGQMKDGSATFQIRYAGKGGELAAKLAAREGSGLKKVTGFDDGSLQVAWNGAAYVAKAPEAKPPAAETKPEEKPMTKPDPSKVEKDPLAYKVHQLPAGTLATFDGWKIVPMNAWPNWVMMETHPDGKDGDFQMIVAAGTPDAQVQANIFEEGAAFFRQQIPAMQAKGEAKATKIGGDEARVQDYSMDYQGKTIQVTSIIIRKKDVCVSLLAFGSDEGWKTYGRALMITAQSITIKESPPDPALVGTWVLDSYSSSGAGTSNKFSHSSSTSMTIYPNGAFTESRFSASNLDNSVGSTSAYTEGGDRGRVVKRGTALSFTYDNGKVWSADFKMDGGALVLNGKYWWRQ